jgi:tetratricopeptide (TPR) repeat protein
LGIAGDGNAADAHHQAMASPKVTWFHLHLPAMGVWQNFRRALNFCSGFEYNMRVRFRFLILALLSLCFAGVAVAQNEPPAERLPVDKSASPPKDNTAEPPRHEDDAAYDSEVAPGESSSKQTRIDIAPPKNDTKDHPNSYEVDTESDVDEFHAFDPHKAMKDIEVGDWYFKKENYKAAVSRYQEALHWKPNDAEATYKLGEAQEKSGDTTAAGQNYQAYLKILPHGPYAEKAHRALDRLKEKSSNAQAAKPN